MANVTKPFNSPILWGCCSNEQLSTITRKESSAGPAIPIPCSSLPNNKDP